MSKGADNNFCRVCNMPKKDIKHFHCTKCGTSSDFFTKSLRFGSRWSDPDLECVYTCNICGNQMK